MHWRCTCSFRALLSIRKRQWHSKWWKRWDKSSVFFWFRLVGCCCLRRPWRPGNSTRGAIRRVLWLSVVWMANTICCWPYVNFDFLQQFLPSSSSCSRSRDNLPATTHKWSSQWTYISCVTRWVPPVISCFSLLILDTTAIIHVLRAVLFFLKTKYIRAHNRQQKAEIKVPLIGDRRTGFQLWLSQLYIYIIRNKAISIVRLL